MAQQPRHCGTWPDHSNPERPRVLYGGRNRLLTVREVAAQLGVCTATVYRLCEIGELPYVRISDAIRVRPADLDALVASTLTVPDGKRPHRQKAP